MRTLTHRLTLLMMAMTLTACGATPEATLTFPPLDEEPLPSYTGPRFRVALAPFKTLDAAKPLLDELGYKGVERSLTELSTNKLVNAGYLQVLERSLLDGVVDNQTLEANAELFDQSTTEKKGGFVGAEYTLVGAIEEVEPNMSKADVDANLPTLASLKGSLQQASVRLGLRLVRTRTGEVIAAGTGHGVIKTKGVGVSANVQKVGAGLSIQSKTPLGFAFNAALHQSIRSLAEKLKESPWSCRVAGAAPPRVMIECGAKERVKAGMVFKYFVRNGEIKDAQGAVIGFDEEESGVAVVKSVQAKMSVATYEGSATPKAGDAVVLEQASADYIEAQEAEAKEAKEAAKQAAKETKEAQE